MRLFSQRPTDKKLLHEKKWGHEVWIENCPEYCGKLLVFKEGGSSSLHYHVKKLETMFLRSGSLVVELIDPFDGSRYEVLLNPGESIQIPRGQCHRLRALMDSELFEFSTTHSDDDSYRVEASSAP